MSVGSSTTWTLARAHRPGTSAAVACPRNDTGASSYRVLLTLALSLGVWVMLAAWSSGAAHADPPAPAVQGAPEVSVLCTPLAVDDSPQGGSPSSTHVGPVPTGTTPDLVPPPAECVVAPALVLPSPPVGSVAPEPVPAALERTVPLTPPLAATPAAPVPQVREATDVVADVVAPPARNPAARPTGDAVTTPESVGAAEETALQVPVVPLSGTLPVVTEPVVTEPVVTEPVVTELAVTGSAVTEPAATDPAVTGPAATDSAATDPAVTEPTATDSLADGRSAPVTGPADSETAVPAVVQDVPAPVLCAEPEPQAMSAAENDEAPAGELASAPLSVARDGSAPDGAAPAPAATAGTVTAVAVAASQDGPPPGPASAPAPVRLPAPLPPPAPIAPVGPTGPTGSSAAASSGSSCYGAGHNEHSDSFDAVLEAQVTASLAQAALRSSSGFAGSVVGGADDPGASPG